MTLAAIAALLASDAPVPPPFAFDAVHQLLLTTIGILGGVASFLFYRLEVNRNQLYLDAKADAAVDREIAASLKSLVERSKP